MTAQNIHKEIVKILLEIEQNRAFKQAMIKDLMDNHPELFESK